jgi:hypothetical protein
MKAMGVPALALNVASERQTSPPQVLFVDNRAYQERKFTKALIKKEH